jgi:hypothetical protein
MKELEKLIKTTNNNAQRVVAYIDGKKVIVEDFTFVKKFVAWVFNNCDCVMEAGKRNGVFIIELC